MFNSFLILFREALEAVLVIGVLLAYLEKTNRSRMKKWVGYGIVLGVIASILSAFLFQTLTGGFEGKTEQIFEGVIMVLGALLLSTLIFWVMRQGAGTSEIELQAERGIQSLQSGGIFLMTTLSVLREGVESVLFLGTSSFSSHGNNLPGGLLGVTAAIILGFVLFKGLARIPMGRLFAVMNFVLIFFAAGLISGSMHEFNEAGLLPSGIEHLWNVNPPLHPDGSFPILHEEGGIGSILHGLFGYVGSPSLLQFGTWAAYLVISFFIWTIIRFRKKKD